MNALSLKSAMEDVLLQGCALLQSVSSSDYARKEDGSSIGTHYRHILDHFLCLWDGIQKGQINYDNRRRSPELETSLESALRATTDLIVKFSSLPNNLWQLPCAVIYSVAYDDGKPQA